MKTPKKHAEVIVQIFFLLSCFMLLGRFAVCAQEPGSTADPLVSKSYLDRLFRFRPIVLKNGAEIKLNPGAMIIVRSGRMQLTGPHGKSVIDLTAGCEIQTGSSIPANHLILVPETPSLGLAAKSICSILALGLQI